MKNMKTMKNLYNALPAERCELTGTRMSAVIQVANISNSATSVKRRITLKNHQ